MSISNNLLQNIENNNYFTENFQSMFSTDFILKCGANVLNCMECNASVC